MAIGWRENRDSWQSTLEPPSVTLAYTASLTGNGDAVRTFASGATPLIYSHERGTLYRQDIRVEPEGYHIWRVVVPYAPRRRDSGQYSIDFDTTGGTLHITNSLATVQRYTRAGADDAPDMKGALGVHGDQVDGTEVIVPALKVNVSFRHPAGIITLAQIKNLARITGRTNSSSFLTFSPGEVLFLGATGREGTESETEIQYQFAMSENLTAETIGSITGVNKKGWEYFWISYEDKVDAGPPKLPTKIPRWLYVERLYRETDLATALGFGG